MRQRVRRLCLEAGELRAPKGALGGEIDAGAPGEGEQGLGDAGGTAQTRAEAASPSGTVTRRSSARMDSRSVRTSAVRSPRVSSVKAASGMPAVTALSWRARMRRAAPRGIPGTGAL